MTDLNISNFSQKVQNYIAKNNIDKNNDGKINQTNGELQTLLSGKIDTATENNGTEGVQRRAYGYFDFEKAMNYYCTLSREERADVVDKTKEAQEVKLEVLQNAITSNYDSVRAAIKDEKFHEDLINNGDGTRKSAFKALKQFISDIAYKFKKAQWNAAQAIDVYIGIRAYADECTLGEGYSDYSDYINRITIDDAEQQVMEKLGYNDIYDFLDEYDKYNTSNAGTDLSKIMEYKLKRAQMIESFQNKLYEVYESAIETRENIGNQKVAEQRNLNDLTIPYLDAIVDNPPRTNSQIIGFINSIPNPQGYTLLQTILKYKADHENTGVKTFKVEVNGKEYVVGQKYMEQGPDGNTRIVTYDRLGNKWDIRGFKVN